MIDPWIAALLGFLFAWAGMLYNEQQHKRATIVVYDQCCRSGHNREWGNDCECGFVGRDAYRRKFGPHANKRV